MLRLALFMTLATACTADTGDEGFSIVHNLAPDESCAFEPGGEFRSRGLIDRQSPNPYVLTPELESRITALEGSEFQRTIALRGAKVEVKNAETGVSLGKFTSLFSGSLGPGGKTSVAFDIITPEILAASGAVGATRVQLVATVTPYGAMGGTSDTIDGVPFQYPVTVCDGCVVQVLGACPLPADTVLGEGSPNGCNIYQDGFNQCCMGAAGPVCPGVIADPE